MEVFRQMGSSAAIALAKYSTLFAGDWSFHGFLRKDGPF